MITIYGTLSNGDHPCVFGWSTSTANNYNPTTSWDRTDGSYDRCAPDNAFTLNPSPCPVDCNGDTVVNTLDFIAFLNAFVAGCP